MAEQTILAGDVGGTKTSLALYGAACNTLREETFQNKFFGSLAEVVQRFLAGLDEPPVRACFGIAGPIRKNRVRMTNLEWLVDGREIEKRFGINRVLLVNDLVATTAGAIHLPPDGLISINSGRPDPQGAIAVLAPGTGLGQAYAVPVNNRLHPFPSEGGHASFAPRSREQIKLLKFMLDKKPHVCVEDVCSGMAIPDLYAFMTQSRPEPGWMAEKMASNRSEDLTPVIVHAANQALTGGPACEPAVQAMHMFADILAAEAANLALKVLSTGGIYLGGGMMVRLRSFFTAERFMAIFCRGKYSEMLAAFPVHIIIDPKTPLSGARALALAPDGSCGTDGNR